MKCFYCKQREATIEVCCQVGGPQVADYVPVCNGCAKTEGGFGYRPLSETPPEPVLEPWGDGNRQRCIACGVERPDITDGACTRPSCVREALRRALAERDTLWKGLLGVRESLNYLRFGGG